MVPVLPPDDIKQLGLGYSGGSTMNPALVQAVGLLGIDPGDTLPADPLSGAVWSFCSSVPTTLSGISPGSMVVGIGAAEGQVAFANASGVPVVVVDDGTVVAPIESSLVLAGNGAVGAPSISFVNSATTGFYRSAADTIGIAVAGALDFKIEANTLTALSGSTIATNTIDETTAAAGVTVDGCLIKDGRAAALATAAMFTSMEQTGTGSSQNIAHGFGSTPSMFWWAPSADATGAFVVSAKSADATNITMTVTTGAKFYVFALK